MIKDDRRQEMKKKRKEKKNANVKEKIPDYISARAMKMSNEYELKGPIRTLVYPHAHKNTHLELPHISRMSPIAEHDLNVLHLVLTLRPWCCQLINDLRGSILKLKHRKYFFYQMLILLTFILPNIIYANKKPRQ